MKNWLANLLSKLRNLGKKPEVIQTVFLRFDPSTPTEKETTLEELLDRVGHDLKLLSLHQTLEATQPRKDLN